MYLEHFGFSEFPFTLTPNVRFFCNLTAYKEALNVIMVSLHNGEGFIKITGEVGTGKTLLCRKLLNSLSNEYVTAYISNAPIDAFTLQKAIAQELKISIPDNVDNHALFNLITDKLVALHYEGKRVVSIIDEAHALSDEALEGLRLLSNLETESSKLLQIILVGQPELDRKLKTPHLRPLEHRISFSYHLPNLCSAKEVLSYIYHRLSSAGYTDPHGSLFSPKAIKLLLKASRGIPRLINILCHKALLVAYGYNKKKIDAFTIKVAINDTASASSASISTSLYRYMLKVMTASLLLITIIGVGSHLIIKLLPYIL